VRRGTARVCKIVILAKDEPRPLKPGFEKWASKMSHRACSHEQFIQKLIENKTILLKK